MCKKKAYQLSVQEIVYIDPYPGIANNHILSAGNKRPTLTLFSGAIGRAYHQLYQPILPYKDELQMLLGFEWPHKDTNSENERLEKENEELRKQIQELKKQALDSNLVRPPSR